MARGDKFQKNRCKNTVFPTKKYGIHSIIFSAKYGMIFMKRSTGSQMAGPGSNEQIQP